MLIAKANRASGDHGVDWRKLHFGGNVPASDKRTVNQAASIRPQLIGRDTAYPLGTVPPGILAEDGSR
jgi:hypothetical protein